jgi:hypothetical protein
MFEGYNGNMYMYAVVLNGPANTYSSLLAINKSTGALIAAEGPVYYSGFSYPQYGRDGRLAFADEHLTLVNDIGRVSCFNYAPQFMSDVAQAMPSFTSLTLTQVASMSVKVPATFVNDGAFAHSFFIATVCDNPLSVESSVAVQGNADISVVDAQIQIVYSGVTTHDDPRFTVYDVSGRAVRSGPLTGERTEISTSGLSSGCYVVTIHSAEGFLQHRKVMLH